MIRAVYSAASGMEAQHLNLDNVAHNIANANTTGFKTRRVQFQDLLYQNLVQPGAAAGQQTVVPTGLQLGLGTRAVEGSAIKWVTDHRKRHDFADEDGDPHTPHGGGPGVLGAAR